MSCGIFDNSNLWKELGDYELKKVEVLTSAGQKTDIKSTMSELVIYEDMFGVYMSASIVFTDASGYMEKLPIIGNEKVTIILQTPGTDTPRVYTFYVYQIEGKERTGPDNAQVVKLNLCSLEMLADPLVKVSRSVKGTQSDIATDIFVEYFGSLGKSISSEKSRSEIKANIPSWSPVQTICWLSSSAVSNSNNTPSYIFFENQYGFNFVTLEELKKGVPVWEYNSEPHTDNKLDKEKLVRKVLDIKQDISANSISMISSGLYGCQAIYHDPVTKEIVETKYDNDIQPSLSKTQKLLPSALESLAASSTNYTTYKPVNQNLYGEGERSVSETSIDWDGRRKAYLAQMLYTRIIITVTGNTLIDIGDVVQLNIKSQAEKETTDKMVSGKYIVSAISHNIGKSGHFMAVELITDGYGSMSKGVVA